MQITSVACMYIFHQSPAIHEAQLKENRYWPAQTILGKANSLMPNRQKKELLQITDL